MNITAPNRVIATLLLVALTACVATDRETEAPIVVQTSTGQVTAERVAEDALVYRDIPFAKPPVG